LTATLFSAVDAMRLYPLPSPVGLTAQKLQAVQLSHPACFVVLLATVIATYIYLPKHGDIYWSDAARHALNGAFGLDLLRAAPLRHPADFAYDYYRNTRRSS
jgi:hypothetical protein